MFVATPPSPPSVLVGGPSRISPKLQGGVRNPLLSMPIVPFKVGENGRWVPEVPATTIKTATTVMEFTLKRATASHQMLSVGSLPLLPEHMPQIEYAKLLMYYIEGCFATHTRLQGICIDNTTDGELLEALFLGIDKVYNTTDRSKLPHLDSMQVGGPKIPLCAYRGVYYHEQYFSVWRPLPPFLMKREVFQSGWDG